MRNLLWRTRRRKAATVLAVLVLVGASAAVAAWLVDSSGDAQSKVGSLVAPTVTPATSAPEQLFPGQTKPIKVKVSNPNSALVLTRFNPGGGGLVSGLAAGCDASNFTLNDVNGLSIPIPNGITDDVTIPGAITLSAAAPQACSGSDVSINGRTYRFSTP